MIRKVQAIIPPLLPKLHKGQAGRVLVVGGSEDYTGAPFFAAMASALVGADMSHILCTKSAGTIIKTYSPNLMVHPYLHDEDSDAELSEKIAPLLDRMHVVLVGPGLGRNADVLRQVESVIKLCGKRNLPLVIDADGLFLVQQKPEVISEYPHHRALLTPNVVEFGRLTKSTKTDGGDDTEQQARALAKHLHCTVLVKGQKDIITNGTELVLGEERGSNRRVSGQGDTLSGALATFVAWTEAYNNKVWDTDPVDGDLHVIAAWGASSVARGASRLAFEKYGRAMATTDVNGLVGQSYQKLFES